MLRRTRTNGQAIVEFALAATLIFFLLAAAVDIGLMFFALQGLHNAAQEGATFGSRWLVVDTANPGAVILDKNGIIDRVRGESGARGGIGFVNLYDLNANGVDDRTEFQYNDPNITIEMLTDPDADGDPTLNVAANTPQNVPCPDASRATIATPCYIRVTVRTVHNMLFPLAPAFSRTVLLHSSYIMPIRESIARGSGGTGGGQVQQCVVPAFIGQSTSAVSSLWSGAGFTGTLTISGPTNGNNRTIQSQSQPPGTILGCNQGMTVTSG